MPNNWKKYKLGEVCEITTGYPFKGNMYEPNGELKVTRGINVTIGSIRWGDDLKCWNHSTKGLEKYFNRKGDILIGMDGSRIGKNRALVKQIDLPSILAQRVARIRAIEGVSNQDFLWHCIYNPTFEKYVDVIQTGSAIPHISPTQIFNFEITLPPLPEQQAIAEILSSLDDKIELNLQTNKTLEEMANALYKHWFVDFGPFLPSGRCPQDGRGPIPGFIESDPDSYREGLIPEGWEVKELRELVTVINGYAFKGTDFIDEGVPVLKIKNVKAGKVIFNELAYVSKEVSEKAVKAKIYFQDILITMTGNRMDGTPETWVGKSAMFLKETGDYFLNQRVSKIKIKEGKPFSNYYLSIMLASEYFQNYFISNSTSSGGQANISPDLIYNIKTVCPSIETLNSFDEIVSKWIMLKCNNENEIETLKQTRDYLLPKLISGEIRVKDAVKLSKSVL